MRENRGAPQQFLAAWWGALRPHQWIKNILVVVPPILGGHQVGSEGLIAAAMAMVLLCALSSLTYVVNDIADLEADRRHWSKRHRAFASGALPVRAGLLVAGVGMPVVLGLGFLLAPDIGITLLAYLVASLAYSFALKRLPLVDVLTIAGLFTLRLVLGTIAAAAYLSPWLMTFAMFSFFSLALAKRHAELVRADQKLLVGLDGRGYEVADRDVTLVFGISAGMASVLILVIYLVDEAFVRSMYRHPDWLWVAPVVINLWISRIWLLAHRGRLTDDPVMFALHDKVSIALGLTLIVGFWLAF